MAVRPGVWLGAVAASLLAASLTLRPGADPVALDVGGSGEAESSVVPPASLAEPPAFVRTALSAPIETDAATRASCDEASEAEETLPSAEVQSCVEDLRDDDIRGNATAAMTRLRRLDQSMIPVLERALTSQDLQQRHLVAEVLYDLDAPASQTLVDVSVQGLGREVTRAVSASGLASPAVSATRYLANHTEAARSALRFGLGSQDSQQRFLCAFLLAQGGHALDTDIVCRELIEHLADNHIRGDALMATHGLYRLGAHGQAALRSWRPYVDEQARSLLDLIELDWRAPPRDRAELAARSKLQRVTTVYHDPALHYDVRRSPVATWSLDLPSR